MEKRANNLNIRWLYLAVGTVSMLFAGILYAWSILKVPLAAEFSWSTSQLALNFTLAMCFFCIGSFLGSIVAKKLGVRLSLILMGILAGAGFVFASMLKGNVFGLYVTYGVAASLGIGVVYNVVISTVNAWFPDKRGLSSGCLLMGFGLSTLIFGKILDRLFGMETVGWRMAYILFGVLLAVVFAVAGIIIKKPGSDTVLPEPKKAATTGREDFEVRDFTTGEMLKRSSFWRAFILITCVAAVGNSVISFARDLAVSLNATAALATTIVGVLSVCNGLGRIITGAVFDARGRRFTMVGACAVTILAAATTLTAVLIGSLPLCVVGLCITGVSYGTAPTLSSAFISAFYGQKHFATNYSIMLFNLMAASFVATVCSKMLTSSGAYVMPFVLLLGLSVVAFVLNLTIKRP